MIETLNSIYTKSMATMEEYIGECVCGCMGVCMGVCVCCVCVGIWVLCTYDVRGFADIWALCVCALQPSLYLMSTSHMCSSAVNGLE